MQNLDIDPNVFMYSFDESSLFTNVPLDETIKICSEALYDKSDSQPVIPKGVFVELMKNATSSVEFSFNNTVYKQTDGVAMGSSLSPALANILLCCCCWFTPPLPWDGGMARTAIQVHAINLIELGQGKSGSPFRTSRGCKLPTGNPTTNKADCH